MLTQVERSEPARLLCPWDSPDKDTGCLATQCCLSLCDPMDCKPARILCPWVILQAGILEWVGISVTQGYRSGKLFPSPGHLPDPGIKATSPALADGFFTKEPPGKPLSVFKAGFFSL